MSIKGKVANIKNLWNKAREEAKSSSFGDAVPVEPGKYTMQLVKGTVGDFGGKRQVMLKLCVVGDSDEKGKVCTVWLSLEEERAVWLARTLGSMGVDLDQTELEDEDDLVAVLDGLVENQTVCNCKVREKDGYVNLYINEVTEVDSADLVDPADVLHDSKSGKSSKSDKSDKPGKSSKSEPEPSDDDEDTVEVGDRVTWKDGKKEMAGEIVSFDKNDNAVVRPDGEKKKTVTLGLDDIEKVAEEGGDDEKPEGGDDDEKPEIEEGDVVMVDVRGKQKSGVVEKVKNGKAHVRVKGEPKPIEVAVDDLELPE